MSVHADTWLADVLSRPVFRVDPPLGVDEGGDPGFYYSKVDVEDVATVRDLSGRGFYVIDVNVTLRRESFRAATLDTSTAATPLQIVPARPEHAADLLEIAGTAFRYSRFHLDPAIPRQAADTVKREWVRSYLEGRRGIELLAAVEEDGRAAGFLAVLESGDARVIDLVGVAPGKHGRGIGGELVRVFVERHGASCSELRVGTQIANVSSLRLYQRQGFEPSSAVFVLHRHVEAA